MQAPSLHICALPPLEEGGRLKTGGKEWEGGKERWEGGAEGWVRFRRLQPIHLQSVPSVRFTVHGWFPDLFVCFQVKGL